MYQCSCVDFAVHATACKHVHTVHSLRLSCNSGDQREADVIAVESETPAENISVPAAMDMQEADETPVACDDE